MKKDVMKKVLSMSALRTFPIQALFLLVMLAAAYRKMRERTVLQKIVRPSDLKSCPRPKVGRGQLFQLSPSFIFQHGLEDTFQLLKFFIVG